MMADQEAIRQRSRVSSGGLVLTLLIAFSFFVPSFSGASPTEVVPSQDLPSGTNPGAIAMAPDGRELYIVNDVNNTTMSNPDAVSTLNLTSGLIERTLQTDYRLTSIAVEPTGDFVYVVGTHASLNQQRLVKISTDTREIVSFVTLSGDQLNDLAISSDGAFAYVVSNQINGAKLIKVDLATLSVVGSTNLPGPLYPSGVLPYAAVALHPSGDFAYVTQWPTGRLIGVNTSTNTVAFNLQVDIEEGAKDNDYIAAYGVTVDPFGRYAFVATSRDTIAKVDLLSNSLVSVSQGHPHGTSVVASPSGDHLYTSNYGGPSAVKINLTTMAISSIMEFGYVNSSSTRQLAVAPDESHLYVSNFGLRNIRRVSLTPPPTAAIRPGDSSPERRTPVTFDASESQAPWGETKEFEWDLDNDGSFEVSSGTTSTVQRSFEDLGEHTVRVRISSPHGVDQASTSVDVVPDSVEAVLSSPDTPVVTGETIVLDAAGSSAESGVIASYEWDLSGNGNFVEGTAEETTSYSEIGERTVTVRVTSRGGGTASASKKVDVRLAPPSGEQGISINNGDIATNSPDVRLRLVWPRLIKNALVSNDGGFVPSETIPVAQQIPWMLRSSGPERQPRIVYVRFRGWEDSSLTFTDDIILDERPPEIIEASGLAGPLSSTGTLRKPKARVVRVQARDSNSGLKTVSVLRKPRGKAVVTKNLVRPGKLGKRKQRTSIKIPRNLKRAFVRVTDVAGNYSRPRRVK